MRNKSILFIAAILFIVSAAPSKVQAQVIPDKIQQYAESTAFRTFLAMAESIGLKTFVDPSELVLGEGFPVYRMKENLSAAASFSDLIGEEAMWKYLITESDGTVVASLQIYDSLENGLGSGGGAESSDFSRCVNKMRELIRKSGNSDDLIVVHYGYADYFLYYSFYGDERVMYVNPYSFNEEQLKVRDYHELITGEEAVAAVRAEHNIFLEQMRENDDSLSRALGGSGLQLSLHPGTSFERAFLIVVAVFLPLLTAGVVLKRKKQRRE